YILKNLDEIGSPKSYNHFPVGWAWPINTPFQWGKQIASHFGGTRNPLVISWPDRIRDKGGIRTQFYHCIDIVPTILDAVGVEQPSEVNGVAQKPIEGVSMVSSFDDAKASEQRTSARSTIRAGSPLRGTGDCRGRTPGLTISTRTNGNCTTLP